MPNPGNADTARQQKDRTAVNELERLRQQLVHRGYTFHVDQDGTERMYRPDGSLAVTARRTRNDHAADIFADVVKGAMERGINVPKVIAEVLRKQQPRGEVTSTADDEPPYTRQNEPLTDGRFDRCTQSAYQTHRFGSAGGLRCDFCGRTWRECERTPNTKEGTRDNGV